VITSDHVNKGEKNGKQNKCTQKKMVRGEKSEDAWGANGRKLNSSRKRQKKKGKKKDIGIWTKNIRTLYLVEGGGRERGGIPI